MAETVPLAAVLRAGEVYAVQRIHLPLAWSFTEHQHRAFAELVFVEGGTVTHRLAGGAAEPLPPGTLLWIRERDRHQLAAPRLRYWNLIVPIAELLRLAAYLDAPALFGALDAAPCPPTLRLAPRDRPRLAAALVRLRRHQGVPEARRHLAAFLCDWLPLLATAARPPRRAAGPSWLPRLLADAEGRLEDGLRVTQLPRLAGVSAAHLSRTFRRHLGMTPSAWLTGRRIGRAAHLLASGERGVLDIALALGFASPSWFHRAFRRVHALTPAAWRQRYGIRR